MSACMLPPAPCFSSLSLLPCPDQLTLNGLLGGLEVQAHILEEAVPALAGGLLLLALEAPGHAHLLLEGLLSLQVRNYTKREQWSGATRRVAWTSTADAKTPCKFASDAHLLSHGCAAGELSLFREGLITSGSLQKTGFMSLAYTPVKPKN